MNQKQRIVQQRVLAQQALGNLKAITELFGAEDNARLGSGDLEVWQEKLSEFKDWIWEESPIG